MQKELIYKHILGLSTGLLIVSLVTNQKYIIFIVLVLNFLSLLSEKFSSVLSSFLEKILKTLGNLVFDFLLLIVYYFVLFPIGIFYKISGGGGVFKFSRTNKTYFAGVNKNYSNDEFKKQW